MTNDTYSRHPVDARIRALIEKRELPGQRDVAEIRERIANAEFASPRSLEAHRNARVQEGQWAQDVSPSGYLNDLHTAAKASTSVGIYVRRGGAICALISATEGVVHEPGMAALPRLVVVYSADWGRIISGYQFSDVGQLWLPDDVIWSA